MNFQNEKVKKASSFILLAFTFLMTAKAQNLQSISGANSPQDDTNPVFLDEKTILFTRAFHPSNRGGKNDPGDIWMTKKGTNGVWQKAVHCPDLSTNGYDVAMGLENPTSLLVYHQQGGEAGIFYYSFAGVQFDKGKEVPIQDLNLFEGQVTGRVSTDGKTIFWSAKGKVSSGNEDLYVSEKTSTGFWTAPLNLGSTINTQGQELGAFYDPKTQRLFFTSNLHLGAKGKDVFVAKKGSSWNSWSAPVKWEQISSAGSEISVALSTAGEVVWTSIQNSDGFADLVTFAGKVALDIPEEFVQAGEVIATKIEGGSLPPEKNAQPIFPKVSIGKPEINFQKIEQEDQVENYINLLVVDAQTGQILNFNLSYGPTKINMSNEIHSSFLISELVSKGGRFIKVSAENYMEKILPIEELKKMQMARIELVQAGMGNSFLLENIMFARGKAELQGESFKVKLIELSDFMKKNPMLKIRINGHTDHAGDPSLNKSLSLQRAAAVRKFLIDQGISPDHLRTSGWGGRKPIAPNDTEEGRAKNRRVEIQFEK